NNTFIVGMTLPELNNTPYVGVEAIRCTGYRIEENLLEIAGEIPGTAETAGIVIIHSLNEPNRVYKNDLRGLHCANLANGDNTEGMIEQGGLQYICNENKGNAFDFAVKGLPTGTIGIAANQGSSELSAGNMFSLETVVSGSEADFQNLGAHITYYGPPPLLNYTESTITLMTADANQCPSRLPTRGAGGLLTGEEINVMELTIEYGTDTFEIFQAANALVRHYLMGEDSIQMDSARIWLTRKGSLDAYFATVDYWLQLRDTTAAQQMLDDIPNLISLSGYTQDEYDYFHDLKSIQIAALQSNQSDSLLVATYYYDLKDIADAGLYYASVQAQVLLNDVASAGYRPAVIMPEAGSQNLAAPQPAGGVAGAISEADLHMQATPNPAVQETVFHYRLPAGTEQAFIVVTTMDGKPVARIPVDAGAGQTRWNTESRQPGIYFYYLTANTRTILTGRVVISK
ncbi:MAG: T9SS type A sorting domain-containing protein, partial [Saprospiraceae bacterium]|nr:T9SS type A sorting domain-containing protein [Saprospiraceae bacterium]